MSNILGTPIQDPLIPGTNTGNSWGTHYAKFGIGGLEVVENDMERDSITQERRTNKIIYNKETKQFNTWNDTKWELLDLTLQTNHNASYLAYLKNSQNVQGGTKNPKNFLWFNLPVYKNLSKFIELDSDRKTIILKDGEYYINFRIYSESKGKGSETVTISIIDSYDNNKIVLDSDNNPLTKSVNIDQYTQIGELYVDGIINIQSLTHIRLLIETNSESIEIKDRNSGGSGLVIQELREGEQTGAALQQWIIDTGVNPTITSYYFDKGFKQTDTDGIGDIHSQTSNNPMEMIIPSGEFIKINSGFTIDEGDDKESFKIKNATSFIYGMFLNNEMTKLLRRKTIHAWGKMLPHYTFGDFVMSVAYWNGNPDEQDFDIVQSVDLQGVITYQSGWHEINHMVFHELNITEEYYDKVPRSGYLVCDIPNGANNLVVFFIPITNKPCNVDINYIRLDAEPSFTSHSIEHSYLYPVNSYVSQMIYSHIKTAYTDPVNKLNYLKKDPIDLYDAVWFNSGDYSLYKGNIKRTPDLKGWQFNEYGDVEVKISFKAMTTINDHVSTVLFYAEKSDSSGQNKERIQQSVKKITLPKTQNTPHNCNISFITKVSQGEVLKFYIKTDVDDECKIFYDKEDLIYKSPVLNVDIVYINSGKIFNKI